MKSVWREYSSNSITALYKVIFQSEFDHTTRKGLYKLARHRMIEGINASLVASKPASLDKFRNKGNCEIPYPRSLRDSPDLLSIFSSWAITFHCRLLWIAALSH